MWTSWLWGGGWGALFFFPGGAGPLVCAAFRSGPPPPRRVVLEPVPRCPRRHPNVDYMYSFDPDWHRDWRWSEKYATQPEILRYLNHVADKYDLRRDIQFDPSTAARGMTTVVVAHTDRPAMTTSPVAFFVMATGCLSTPKEADIEGIDRFAGDVYFTSRWPHDGVDFTGKRVAVIGTGLLRRPVDSAHRRGGAAACRVPAHPELLDPGPQRPALAGEARTTGRGRGGIPRSGEGFAEAACRWSAA